MRSSVDKSASSFESFVISPLTKSKICRTTAGGQLSDAISRRLANAAERPGDVNGPRVRCENTIESVLKSISAIVGVFADLLIDEEGECGCVSMAERRLRGRMMAYK